MNHNSPNEKERKKKTKTVQNRNERKKLNSQMRERIAFSRYSAASCPLSQSDF